MLGDGKMKKRANRKVGAWATALGLTLLSCLALTSAASAQGIVNPAADRAYNVQPVDFRGNASLNAIEFFKYSYEPYMQLYYTE